MGKHLEWHQRRFIHPTTASLSARAAGDPNIAFIAAYQGSAMIAGAIANRSDTVVGLSNLFAPPEESVSFWAGCVATAQDCFPELPLVGYESGPDLALAEAVGFEKLQSLRVWVR